MGVTRRGFVQSLFGGAVALPGVLPLARDPRLTARPRRPFREAEVGVTEIAPDRERGALLYVPTSYTAGAPAPLLVALHGAGGSAESWSRLYDTCDERGVILVAPDSRGRSWDRAIADFGPDVRFIDAVLRYTFDRCDIDAARIALAGFSDGASYALSLGPSNGDLFTHLIAWSPGFSDPTDPIVGEPLVFVSHGTSDRVLPVAASRHAIVPMFEMDGYAIEYLEFDGTHEMPPEVVSKAMEWFLG
jgi:phospholipase/carboxylesterase